MWVFGYGTLLLDGWDSSRGCLRRVPATLPGFRRAFNKASVRNWGTKELPGPTLNLETDQAASCRGIAFEFPDEKQEGVLAYVREREECDLAAHEIQLDGGLRVNAFVPIYAGGDLILQQTLPERLEMARKASGICGSCYDYMRAIASKLSDLDLKDPVVTQFWQALQSMPDPNRPVAVSSPATPSPVAPTPPRLRTIVRDWGARITFCILLLFFAAIAGPIFYDLPVIRRLTDPGFARGLITFLISVATIGLAFILVFQAFSAEPSSDDRFRRAREVFAGLMGVLGTIVGFYFGSAEKPVGPLEVSALRVTDSQVFTYVSGGVRPYRYLVLSTDKDFKKEIKGVSEDGWIVVPLDRPAKPGSTITVEVTDSREQKESRKIDFPDASKPEKAPSAPQPGG